MLNITQASVGWLGVRTCWRPAQAIRGKNVLSKFCDSVLQKSAKIRSLNVDLEKNFDDEMAVKLGAQWLIATMNNRSTSWSLISILGFPSMAPLLIDSPTGVPMFLPLAEKNPRSVRALKHDLVALENIYNTCSDHLANGDASEFGVEWLSCEYVTCIKTKVRVSFPITLSPI